MVNFGRDCSCLTGKEQSLCGRLVSFAAPCFSCTATPLQLSDLQILQAAVLLSL